MEPNRNILGILEEKAVLDGHGVCFIDAMDAYAEVSWQQVRVRSLLLALAWREKGVERGDAVAVDMANCPEFIYALLASAYGGQELVALNVRLTAAEKRERLASLANGLPGAGRALRVHTARDIAGLITKHQGKDPIRLREFARTGERLFVGDSPAFVMFTSGTQGKPKAARLRWDNILGAAAASNLALGVEVTSRWQLTLPLYHVGGLQILIRSLLAGSPFLLYGKFDAEQVLRDAKAYGCTHVSVVDKMLQDMFACPVSELLGRYRCVLLGGSAPNPHLIEEAVRQGVNVVTSYGMTETCSHIAWAPAQEADRGMLLLPGYRAIVLDADSRGYGKLAVAGPGVFHGYANAPSPFTADGYFVTGDSAKLADGRLLVAERTSDMFVSGGENVYPEEIRGKLLQVPGVTEACVFGAEDPEWGQRPVAFVEMAQAARSPGFNSRIAARDVAAALSAQLARIYQPREIYVLPVLPRRGIGKVNRMALQRRYATRIDVVKVECWRTSQPFVGQMRTAKVRLRQRESLVVRLTDAEGRTGVGEDVAFDADWYLPETLEQDLPVIEKTLAPLLLEHVLLHPSEASALFACSANAVRHPLACAALESAVWDLFGKTVGRSIRSLIGGEDGVRNPATLEKLPEGWVPGGAVIGIKSLSDTLEAVRKAQAFGYPRVKLKVKPGHDLKIVRAVRAEFPRMSIILDANQSYDEGDLDALRALAAEGIDCMEEPLDPAKKPAVGPQDLHARLARLQRELRCPIALDESWTSAAQLEKILAAHPDLRCVVVKIAKFGGVQPALDFCSRARERGVGFWLGGMYDTGVSKRLHAAFGTLSGCILPGDISDTANYFEVDICIPPLVLEDGALEVNPQGHETGLGCELDEQALERIAFDYRVFE